MPHPARSLRVSDLQPEASEQPTPAPTAQVIPLEVATEAFFQRELLYRDLLNALPAAIYTTDAEGRITFYNEAAVDLAGRRPALGEMWCVTWRLYTVEGTPLPHDECPMAIAIKEGRPVRGVEAVAERPDGSRVTFVPYPTPLYDDEGAMVGAINMLVDISDRKAAEERQQLLAHEVNHRANNLLSVVQSIVRLTRKDDVPSFRAAIEGRIQALARTHAVLAENHWQFVDLQRLVTDELGPYMDDRPRAWIAGKALPLQPAAAQSIALIVHELATNSAKYGALSAQEGRVAVEWRRETPELVLIRWHEQDGPTVKPPSHRGVGSTVIARAAAQLGGVAEYDWRPNGLVFELRADAGATLSA